MRDRPGGWLEGLHSWLLLPGVDGAGGAWAQLGMAGVTLKLRFLLPAWLRWRRKGRRQSEDSEHYVDFMWTFRKDYENCYENVPFEKNQDKLKNPHRKISQALPNPYQTHGDPRP